MESSEFYLLQAESLLKEGAWAKAIDILEPMIASNQKSAETRRCVQATAVAHVMMYGSKGDWRGVLRLQNSDDANVRSQFKRLALIIHPDQCPLLPYSSEAFVLLTEAQRQMTKRCGSEGEERSRNVRQRADQRPEENLKETVAEVEAEEGYEWWSEWNPRVREELQCNSSFISELSSLSLDELRIRVVELQHQLLKSPSEYTLDERKQRLRTARSMLSDVLHRRREEDSLQDEGLSRKPHPSKILLSFIKS